MNKEIIFFLPGMFFCNGKTGKYPAVSITGDQCALDCEHCHGQLLKTMLPVDTPEKLYEQCCRFKEKGAVGLLISGGCDEKGRLPWESFLPVIKKIKENLNLIISVHSGIIDEKTADGFKRNGVSQVLIDVIGDNETYKEIYHVPFGIEQIENSLKALSSAGLTIVPHIVCGLYFGKIRGEFEAVKMISRYKPSQIVIVSYMPLAGTDTSRFSIPDEDDVEKIILFAKQTMPDVSINLGCARQRGNIQMEIKAIRAGVSKMALPSDEAIDFARSLGLTMRFQKTCCCVNEMFSDTQW